MTDGMLSINDLFEVQREALKQSRGKPGFAYFLEQGLGKTRTVAFEFYDLVSRDLIDVLFVVVPRSLRGAWRDEFEELGLPYPVILVESDKKAFARFNEIGKQPMVVVLHYEQVLTHGTRILNALLERKRRVYVALDESVRIKAHDSVIGERLWLLCNGLEKVKVGRKTEVRFTKSGPVKFRRILSGTPAPQGPHDLWSQFRFILGQLQPYFAWRNLYCRMGGFQGKKILGSQNLDILRQRTGGYAFRAKKADWTDLPEKLNGPIREVELNPDQKRAYTQVINDFVIEMGDEDFITVEMAITVKNKLQQIASGWVYDNEHNVREIVPIADNPKLQEAREVIEATPGKILVFYFFRPTRRYLEQLAADMGIDYVFLESGLKDAELDERKRRFNEEDSVKVAFCQTDAVKEGHTLLGTRTEPCYNTLFLENTYSLYSRSQAEDRNHRHGQYNPVTYHDITTGREDKAIIKALQAKRELQEAVLSEFTSYAPGLRTELDT